jgi:hypothetical protein
MAVITDVKVPFAGARSGTAKGTFGQRGVWGELKTLEPHTQILNITSQVPVPPGLGLPDVLAAVGDLLLRHECLRTRFWPDDRGVLWQEVAGDGEFTAEVWDFERGEDMDATARDAIDEIELARFQPGRPVRILVCAVGETPLLMLIGVSHLAADMLSARLIRQDMADLLAARAQTRPAPALPPRRQPLDQAAFEQSPAALRDRARVHASWQSRLESAPRTMFPASPKPPTPQTPKPGPRFLHAILSSRALPLAVDVLARRHQVSTAITVMAAEAVMLGHQAAADHCAIQVSVGNRTAPDAACSTGVFKQHSLAVIDLRDASFAQIVRRTWKAWLLAQRTGMYDPVEIGALRRSVELSRGVALDLSCHFNDLRGATRPVMADVAPEQLQAAAAASVFTCEQLAAYYAKFQLRLKEEGQDLGRRHQPPPGAPRRVLMHAFTDGWALPAEKLRELMFGLERLLIWQAIDAANAELTLDPQTIAEVSGMPALAGRPGWVRRYGGPVEVAAVGRLLKAAAADSWPPPSDQAAASLPVTVLVRPGTAPGDGDRLVGYVAVPDRAVRDGAVPTPEQLHRSCVARLTGAPPHGPGWPSEAPPSYLPQWLSAIAPERYVVCADRPGMAQDEAGWLARPVLAEGTGRAAEDSSQLAARAS